MNSTRRGKQSERRTVEFLESLGFKVISVVKSSFKVKEQDFFGLWDHIAVAHNAVAIGDIIVHKGDTLYVQTKTNKRSSKLDREAMQAFPAHNKVEILWITDKKESGWTTYTKMRVYNLSTWRLPSSSPTEPQKPSLVKELKSPPKKKQTKSNKESTSKSQTGI